MKHIKQIVLLLLFSFTSLFLYSQKKGVIIEELKQNKNIKLELLKSKFIERRNLNDTLSLPFFDDFTTTFPYPDNRFWLDSNVYVNKTMAISPPSYGVATFDQLNKLGNPYDGINRNLFGAYDTLTSKPINLLNYKVGFNTISYSLGDSIYLSFFYQGQGLGDRPESRDSLVVQFKKNDGSWNNVWSSRTLHLQKDFKSVLIPILSTEYLHHSFQFRFLHYTSAVGFLNHVNIDYVILNKDRNAGDSILFDVAINKVPTGLLKFYSSMPYEHYKQDASNQSSSDHGIGTRNNSTQTVQTQFQYLAMENMDTLAFYPFSSSSRNIFSQMDTIEKFAPFTMTGLNSEPYKIVSTYRINPLSNDFTPTNLNSLGNNNQIQKEQIFDNYYAYDDGSAEGGIGLDYGDLPPGKSFFALKFNLTKTDTFRGLSIYFNQSSENVASRQFALCIWQRISEPPLTNTSNDFLIYETDQFAPVYTDSINGFHTFLIDTTIILPPGNFYVGWTQVGIFNLNVGYDRNYEYLNQNTKNPNIFFNLNGFWESVDNSITGTPMIRPIFGKQTNNWGLSSPNLYNQTSNTIQIFPNPCFDRINLIPKNEIYKASYSIQSMDGKIIQKGIVEDTFSIETSNLISGMYVLTIENKNQIFYTKFIKQ
jgi:hypothetical protein